MKISRRGLFGLGAGAVVVPFVKPATPAFAGAVEEMLPRAAKVASEFKPVRYGGYTDADGALRVGVIPDSIWGTYSGTQEVIERAKNRLARARMDAVYAKMYGDL